MVDGVSGAGENDRAFRGAGTWSDERDANLLDGGAPFYGTYACADGRWIAGSGALEPQFYARFLAGSHRRGRTCRASTTGPDGPGCGPGSPR